MRSIWLGARSRGSSSRAEAIELAIVAAGARRDLGELDAAVVGLQLPELDPAHREPWSARLFYAYADNLAAAGREAEAVQWFVHAADADDAGETDAAARLAELTGEPLPDDDVEFGEEDIAAGEQPADADAGQQEPEDDDRVDDAVVEQAPVDEIPAGDEAEIEPVSDSTEPAALTEPLSRRRRPTTRRRAASTRRPGRPPTTTPEQRSRSRPSPTGSRRRH